VIQSSEQGICKGKTILLYTSLPYSKYKWSTGENTSNITIDQAGVFNVIVTNSNGCNDTAKIEIFDFEQPKQPSILKLKCLLSSDITPSGASYKWWFDNSGAGYKIVGSNNPTFNAQQTGDGFYKLQLTNEKGCSETSSIIVITGCGNVNVSDVTSQSVEVYPNPNDGSFKLDLNGYGTDNLEVRIVDVLGTNVYSNNFGKKFSNKIVLSDELNSGTYIVWIKAGNQILHKTIAIIK
jgi:hypothetical protein